MRDRVRWFGVAVLLGVCLCGCAASTFSDLQNDFVRIYQHKDRCTQLQDEGKSLPVDCLVNHEEALLGLAREAEKAAPRAADTRTEVGFFRIGAVAAWQAGEKGFEAASLLASKGENLCKGLERERFGAPRDCAILRFLPALIAHDNWVKRWQSVEDRDVAQQAEFFETFSSNYRKNTWDIITKHETALQDNPLIDRSMVDYVRLQKMRFYCMVIKVRYEIQVLRGAPAYSGKLKRAYEQLEGEGDEMYRSLGSRDIACDRLK